MKKITLFAFLLFALNNAFTQTALQFDPIRGEQKVSIPTITCPAEFTLEAWINFSGSTDDYNTIIEFGNDSPYFGLAGGKLTLYGAAIDTNTLPTNQWLAVAATYSTTSGKAQLYINGALVKETENNNLDLSGIGMGIGYNSGDICFKGAIDNVSIWNVVRTDAEIASDMNTCFTGNETGLVAFYNFNEGSGTTVNDLTANNFDGTLTNMDPATDWIASGICTTLANYVLDKPSVSHYPNPSKDFIRITGNNEVKNYKIYDVLGKVVKQGIFENETINVQELNHGIYTIVINQTSFKFIKE